MPVWGVWLDDRFYFSAGRRSRKARNLATNPRCVICTERADEAVILEGVAEEVRDRKLLKIFADLYKRKYDWDMESDQEPVYAVRPRVAFGLIEHAEEFGGTATRWAFDQD